MKKNIFSLRKLLLIFAIAATIIQIGCANFESLDPPTNVKASDADVSNKSIIVTWNAVAGADFYQIYRSETPEITGDIKATLNAFNPTTSYSDSSFQSSKIKEDNTSGYTKLVNMNLIKTTYEDKAIVQGKKYYYRVKASNMLFVESEMSDYDSGEAGTFPDYPGSFTTSKGTHTDRIGFSWTKIDNAVSYKIYRSTDLNGTYTEIANLTDGDLLVPDPSLQNGSVKTAKLPVVTDSTNPAIEEYKISLEAHTKMRISLSFSHSEGDIDLFLIPDDVKYDTYYLQKNSLAASETVTDNESLIYTAAANTDYKLVIVKWNGDQQASNIKSYKDNLNCEFISNVNLNEDHYIVWVYAGTGIYILAAQTATIGITIGDIYKEISFSGAGYFEQSEVVSAINNAFGETVCYPESSNNIKIVSTTGSITLKNVPDWAIKQPIDKFLKSGVGENEDVLIQPDPIPSIDPATDNSDYLYIDNSVTQGTHYFYKIKSVDAKGEESLFSEANNGYSTFENVLDPPLNIATDGSQVGKVIVSWDEVTDGDIYRVYRGTSETGLYINISGDLDSSMLTYEDNTVNLDDMYYYAVTVLDSSGKESSFSGRGAGQAEISPIQFLGIHLDENDYFQAKTNAADSNPGLSTNENIAGDNGGNCHWYIEMDGLGGISYYVFTDYQDFDTKWNGTVDAHSNASGNGMKYGTVNFTGKYEGYIKYNIQFTNRHDSGGYFLVSYPLGAPEEKINFTDVR